MLLMGYEFLILIFSLVALANWRHGVYMLIIVAAIQDPVRKMIPGVPAYLVLSVMPIWVAIVLSFYTRQRGLWGRFSRDYSYLASVIAILLAWMVIPAGLAASYGPNSYQLALIGALSYGMAIIGVLAGFHYPRRARDIERILIFYCVVQGIALIGGPLERMHVRHLAIGTRALKMVWIRYSTGGDLKMLAGFYRSPDVMGWHAVTVCMASIALAHMRRGYKRYLWAAMSAWAFVSVMLCGRRKMALMLPIFGIMMVYIHLRATRKRRVVVAPVGIILMAAVLGLMTYFVFGRSAATEAYYLRTTGEVASRLEQHGLSALVETYRQNGFFGAGLGTATQGRQHLNCAKPRTWQEGGLSRLLVELGVPGFLLALWVAYALFVSLKKLIGRFALHGAKFPLFAGLISILVANVGSFIVSQQIFGDPFVNTFMALVIGMVLSGHRIMAPEAIRAKTVARATPPRNRRRALQPA